MVRQQMLGKHKLTNAASRQADTVLAPAAHGILQSESFLHLILAFIRWTWRLTSPAVELVAGICRPFAGAKRAGSLKQGKRAGHIACRFVAASVRRSSFAANA